MEVHVAIVRRDNPPPKLAGIDTSLRRGEGFPRAVEIAKRDQVTVSEEEIDAELQRYADQTGHSVASVKARLQKDGELPVLAPAAVRPEVHA